MSLIMKTISRTQISPRKENRAMVPKDVLRREKFDSVVRELQENAGIRTQKWRLDNFYKCFTDTLDGDPENEKYADETLYMVSTLYFPDKVLVKSDTLRPHILREVEKSRKLVESINSASELLTNYRKHIEDLHGNSQYARKVQEQIGRKLAVPIRNRKINIESDLVRDLRESNEPPSFDGDDLRVLHPMPMYRYGEGFMLDRPSWNGQTGEMVPAYKTGGRTCSHFKGKEIVQQKGGFLNKISMGENPNSDQPIGALTFVNAQTEYDNVKMIGEDVLEYKVKLYNLGEFRPDERSGESFDLSVLERKSYSKNNNIHLRIDHLIKKYPTSAHMSSEPLESETGINVVDSLKKAGRILRQAHDKGVFPLNYHLGNISVDGYPLDFEGSPNKTNVRDYLKLIPGGSKKNLKIQGLEAPLQGLLNISYGDKYVSSFVSGYTGLDDTSKITNTWGYPLESAFLMASKVLKNVA